MKKISLVVPCYNEEENAHEAYDVLKKIMDGYKKKYAYEIIFTDNDSSDKTPEILREIAKKDKNVKVILNNRNFGPENSLFHGILQSSGDAVIYLASDLQDPPDLIPEFISQWEQGNLVVWGQKTNSEENALMYFLRTVYYKTIKFLSPIKQYEHVTGFGLYDKKVVEELRKINDPWPMLRNVIPNLGYKPVLIPYMQPKRLRGSSSYNFFRYFNTALNSLVHTSKAPLKFAIYIGFICAGLSFLTGCFYLAFKLLYWDSFTLGLAPVLVAVFFIGSLQIMFLGLLGEYVLNILDRESFTCYVVEKERINFDEPEK